MDQNTSAVSKSDQNLAKEDAATRWRKLIEQQRESGLPVSAYCRERGLSAASMFAWRRRLRPASSLPGAGIFKRVKVVSEGGRADERSDSVIELCLPGGRHLIVRRGFDRQLLLDVIDALEHGPSTMEARS
jgi:hypothetical protein